MAKLHFGAHFCHVLQQFLQFLSHQWDAAHSPTPTRARLLASLSTSLSIVPPFIMCIYLVMRASSLLTRNLLHLKICSTLLNGPQRKLDKYIPLLPRMLTKALAAVSQFRNQLHQCWLLGTLNRYGPMFELQDRQLAKMTCRLHHATDNQQQCKMKTANLVYSSIPKPHSCRYVFWTMFPSKIMSYFWKGIPGQNSWWMPSIASVYTLKSPPVPSFNTTKVVRQPTRLQADTAFCKVIGTMETARTQMSCKITGCFCHAYLCYRFECHPGTTMKRISSWSCWSIHLRCYI